MFLKRFVTNDNEPYIQYNVYLNMLSYTSAKIFEQIIFVYQIWEKNFNELFMMCI